MIFAAFAFMSKRRSFVKGRFDEREIGYFKAVSGDADFRQRRDICQIHIPSVGGGGSGKGSHRNAVFGSIGSCEAAEAVLGDTAKAAVFVHFGRLHWRQLDIAV